jgi:hypothetical protein
VTVIGITGSSFANPQIIFRASLSPDPGYFGERLTVARQVILHEWLRRASSIATAKNTDLLGHSGSLGNYSSNAAEAAQDFRRFFRYARPQP